MKQFFVCSHIWIELIYSYLISFRKLPENIIFSLDLVSCPSENPKLHRQVHLLSPSFKVRLLRMFPMNILLTFFMTGNLLNDTVIPDGNYSNAYTYEKNYPTAIDINSSFQIAILRRERTISI